MLLRNKKNVKSDVIAYPQHLSAVVVHFATNTLLLHPKSTRTGLATF